MEHGTLQYPLKAEGGLCFSFVIIRQEGRVFLDKFHKVVVKRIEIRSAGA